MAPVVHKWWKEGLVYQIWPASYKDGNGDGIGDIVGIMSTLDHLSSLGVDIIWISPAYASPQKDMGYDISDYEAIDPQYGTVEDAEKLIRACHDRGIRVIFDLVVNHTSDEHAWFRESRSSKGSPKRDWYIWRPAKYDANGKRQPPNNWRSVFGGSAWEWDEPTQEYYLHIFAKEQPDLNWETADARKAIYDSALTFWLERGIDGFRVDTVNMYSKPPGLPDASITDPDSEFQVAGSVYCNGPRMHEFLKEMHAATLSKYDTMTVGELPDTPDQKEVRRYVSAVEKELDMVFQFEAANLDKSPTNHFATNPIKLSELKKAITFMQELSADPSNDAWGTAFTENHDLARSVTRYATDAPKYRARAAKMLAILQIALSGTLFMYQGQEIAMANAPLSWAPEEYKDVYTANYLAELRSKYQGVELEEELRKAMVGVQRVARDHARTPVHWSSQAPSAGFSPADAKAKPWMRVTDDYAEGWNVEDQDKDKDSVLNFWRRALKVRKEHRDVCVYGTFRVCGVGGENVFAYVKGAVEGKGRVLVVLNLTAETQKLELEQGMKRGKKILGNIEKSKDDELLPWEGRMYALE